MTKPKRDNNNQAWPFDQPQNVAAMVTRQVLSREEPIRYAVHYEDDNSWGFFCGTTNETGDYRLVHLEHVLAMDDTLREVADLQPGWSAWREDGESPWERFQEDTE
jgi:hypothetical protein